MLISLIAKNFDTFHGYAYKYLKHGKVFFKSFQLKVFCNIPSFKLNPTSVT